MVHAAVRRAGFGILSLPPPGKQRGVSHIGIYCIPHSLPIPAVAWRDGKKRVCTFAIAGKNSKLSVRLFEINYALPVYVLFTGLAL